MGQRMAGADCAGATGALKNNGLPFCMLMPFLSSTGADQSCPSHEEQVHVGDPAY